MKRQRGVALIYVLVIFVMVTLMASQIISELLLNTDKSARHFNHMQARHYALGAENYFATLLKQDLLNDLKSGRLVDHWHEKWADDAIDLQTEEGEITILSLDEQGQFNLNLIMSDITVALKMFRGLLAANELDTKLVHMIHGWINNQQSPSTGAWGDNHYLLLDPPYRAGKTALASTSELLLMDSLSAEEYEKLVPMVSAIPATTLLNVNTMSADVLKALNERISDSQAEEFVNARPKNGFSDMKEVLELPLFRQLPSAIKNKLTLRSSYFSAYIRARYRDSTYYLHSRIARSSNGRVTVISREVGVFPRWVQTLRESVR